MHFNNEPQGVRLDHNSVQVITCGICFKILNKAVTLPCHDSFCYNCIQTKLAQNHDNGFLCTLCASPFPELTTKALDEYVDKAIDSYVKSLSSETYGQSRCHWCEEAVATLQCVECMCIYCDDCSVAMHKRAAKRNHITGKLTEASRSFHRRCVRRGHEEYKAEFYCTQCEDLCCAYCLQVGPHKEHPSMSVSQAATEARQRMHEDMQWLEKGKNKLDRQTSEFNRVALLYTESYDTVEKLITERFQSFKQELMQRELEVRRTLAALRDSGDMSMTNTRRQFLVQLNRANECVLRYRCLQSHGADYEVLEGYALLNTSLRTELPSVTGTGFKLTNMGDLVVSGLDVQLDLKALGGPAFNGCSPGAERGRTPLRGKGLLQLEEDGMPPLPSLSRPLRLTFPVDEDVEATVRSNGVYLRCTARGGSNVQVGVRSKESLEAVLHSHPEDRAVVSWQVRLENISDSFLGVVEKTDRSVVPEGFYWKPSCAGVIDGNIGHVTPAARRLPACRNGDVICFTYHMPSRSLRIIVNQSLDCGVVVTDLHPRVGACFIFYPGEALTLLF